MIKTKLTVSTISGETTVRGEAPFATLLTVDVRHPEKPFAIGPRQITLETEGEFIQINFTQRFGKLASGAYFAVVGVMQATIYPETGQVLLSGTGKCYSYSGCDLKTQ